MKDAFSVRRIPAQETYEWILKKHYAHRIPSISYAFGLYEDKILIGICTFGVPASPSLCIGVCGDKWKTHVIELNRLCVDSDEYNITSWFVAKCLSMFRKGVRIIISYADTAQGHIGKIYQACNFIYTGITKERTDIGTDDNTHSRHYDKNIDYKINRKHRSAKHRYVYFAGNRKMIKRAMKDLNYKPVPYPKGETKRYDASYKPKVQGVLFT